MNVPLADRGTEGERERGTHYAILYSLPSLSFSSQYSVVTHHKCMSLLQTEVQRERERERGTHYAILYSLPSLSFSSQ